MDGAGRCAPAPRPARPPPPQRRGHRRPVLARRRRRSGLTGRRERRMPVPAITRTAWPRAASSASTGRISGMLPPPWNTAARTHAKGVGPPRPARGRASAGRGEGGRNSTGHASPSWGSLISSVWFEPLAPVPSGRFLPLASAKTVQAVRRAHLEAFKIGRDRRPVRNIERMHDAPLHTGAVSIAKYAAAMRDRPANRLLIGRYRAIPYHDRGGLCRPRCIEHVPLRLCRRPGGGSQNQARAIGAGATGAVGEGAG